MIEHFHIEEVPEGERKGLVCFKVYCTKDTSEFLKTWLYRLMQVNQAGINLMGALGMK